MNLKLNLKKLDMSMLTCDDRIFYIAMRNTGKIYPVKEFKYDKRLTRKKKKSSRIFDK